MMLTTVAHSDDDVTRSSFQDLIPSKGVVYRLTSSNKRLKSCRGWEEPLSPDASVGLVLCRSMGSDQDGAAFLGEESLSTIAHSTVSISLSDGPNAVYTCSGVTIQREQYFTRLLTPANLAVTFLEKRGAGCGVTIQVRDVFNNLAEGFVEEYNLDHGTAFVKVNLSLDVCVARLCKSTEILPSSNLVAIQLIDSGALRRVLTYSTTSEVSKLSCEFSKLGDGVPLFDGDGNLVSMNLSSGRHTYTEMSFIMEKLEQFERKKMWRAQMKLDQSRRRPPINPREVRRRDGKHYNMTPQAIELSGQDLSEAGLNSLGYPKHPGTDVDGSMVLVNTFEEIFGEPYDSGKGVWSTLSKTVGEYLSQSVVSLASFTGKMRFFACSGIIINWRGCTTILTSASLVRNPLDEKNIIENLRIEVLLPNKLHTEGILEHYNLHYNVAIVSFKGFGGLSATNILGPGGYDSSIVVAVGRCFESSMLMATKGSLTCWQSRFDCDAIKYSTCEITKAGIGGPLVDLEGRFVGMNFYDWKEGTPYLPEVIIRHVLAHFEKKGIVKEADEFGNTNRWPVPKPLWRRQPSFTE